MGDGVEGLPDTNVDLEEGTFVREVEGVGDDWEWLEDTVVDLEEEGLFVGVGDGVEGWSDCDADLMAGEGDLAFGIMDWELSSFWCCCMMYDSIWL